MKVLKGDPAGWGPPPARGSAVTIGVFDGVHRGHQAVLADVADRAGDMGGLDQIILTFDVHPRSVTEPDASPQLLTSLDQRLGLFESLGVDAVGLLPFHQVREISPDLFVSLVLVEALGARLVAVGADFRFGKERAGDVATLRSAGVHYGFEVDAIDLRRIGTGPISSTTIRQHIVAGQVADAAALLGRPFEVVGVVGEGDKRGRTIGVPTANVAAVEGMATPGRGVYAGTVRLPDGAEHHAVVNVGVRPTFGGNVETIEAHLLDFDGDLYGATIGVRFLHRLRDERSFDGIETLVAQIQADIADARAMLGA